MDTLYIDPEDTELKLPLPDYCVVQRKAGHIDVWTSDGEDFLFTIPANPTFTQPLMEQIVRAARIYDRAYKLGVAEGRRLLQVELRALLDMKY